MVVLSGAPLLAQQRGNQEPPQRGGPPNPDTPQILVAVLQSPEKGLGVQAADEIRRRIQVEHSAKELYAVPKQAINNTLEASGYRADSALNASDLMELAKQVHGDYVLEGKIEPGRVFDRVIGLDEVPDGYRAMNDREAIKVMIAV